MDVISKARRVVEEAQRQQFILIKAKEAADAAAADALDQKNAAYNSYKQIMNSNADAKQKAIAQLKYAELEARKQAAMEAQKQLDIEKKKKDALLQAAQDAFNLKM